MGTDGMFLSNLSSCSNARKLSVSIVETAQDSERLLGRAFLQVRDQRNGDYFRCASGMYVSFDSTSVSGEGEVGSALGGGAASKRGMKTL